MKILKKSLLAILFATFLGVSCSNEGVDIKKDYVFVKSRETSEVYGIKFYTSWVGESLMDYKIATSSMLLDSNVKRIFLGKDYHIFPPDSSINGKLIETHRDNKTGNWGIIEFYQFGKTDIHHF